MRVRIAEMFSSSYFLLKCDIFNASLIKIFWKGGFSFILNIEQIEVEGETNRHCIIRDLIKNNEKSICI